MVILDYYFFFFPAPLPASCARADSSSVRKGRSRLWQGLGLFCKAQAIQPCFCSGRDRGINVLLLLYMTEGISPAQDISLPDGESSWPAALPCLVFRGQPLHPSFPLQPVGTSSPEPQQGQPPPQLAQGRDDGSFFANPGSSPSGFLLGWISGEAREGQSSRTSRRWGRRRDGLSWRGSRRDVVSGAVTPAATPAQDPIHLPATALPLLTLSAAR